jgi:hypothetical protein
LHNFFLLKREKEAKGKDKKKKKYTNITFLKPNESIFMIKLRKFQFQFKVLLMRSLLKLSFFAINLIVLQKNRLLGTIAFIKEISITENEVNLEKLKTHKSHVTKTGY